MRKKLASEFGLIFRQNGDTGEERTQKTPCSEDIECNLEMFLRKWENMLSEATIDSIRKLRHHIHKGCCSDIPAGAGTQKNERLHKLLKKSLLGGASVISPELAIAVLSLVLYIWSLKRNPCAKKHAFNAKIIPVVPVELKQKHLLSRSNIQQDDITSKFKSSNIPSEVPIVMRCKEYGNCQTSNMKMENDILESELTTHEYSELKNENVVKYVVLRALHLNDVCGSIGSKCINRDFDIVDFPFTDIERFVKVLHSASVRPNVPLLDMDMNQECLERNLLSFGLQRDVVPGDGNCCFVSIAIELSKLMVSLEGNNDVAIVKLVDHLISMGLCKADIETDTSRLRQLFCDEIETNQQNYQMWVDFDIKEEIEKFARSGWFDSSLGDLCVLACSNILKTTIVVITSLTSVPYIPFIPKEILSDSVLYIAFNHSSPGHYDGTKGIFCVINASS